MELLWILTAAKRSWTHLVLWRGVLYCSKVCCVLLCRQTRQLGNKNPFGRGCFSRLGKDPIRRTDVWSPLSRSVQPLQRVSSPVCPSRVSPREHSARPSRPERPAAVDQAGPDEATSGCNAEGACFPCQHLSDGARASSARFLL